MIVGGRRPCSFFFFFLGGGGGGKATCRRDSNAECFDSSCEKIAYDAAVKHGSPPKQHHG